MSAYLNANLFKAVIIFSVAFAVAAGILYFLTTTIGTTIALLLAMVFTFSRLIGNNTEKFLAKRAYLKFRLQELCHNLIQAENSCDPAILNAVLGYVIYLAKEALFALAIVILFILLASLGIYPLFTLSFVIARITVGVFILYQYARQLPNFKTEVNGQIVPIKVFIPYKTEEEVYRGLKERHGWWRTPTQKAFLLAQLALIILSIAHIHKITF